MEKFELNAAFTDRAWLDDVIKKLKRKLPSSVARARKTNFIPYTSQGENWCENDIGWWTNGFWPAMMWQMYLLSGDMLYREEALRAESMLDAALKDFKNISHDAGFMWLIHSGVRFHFEKNRDSFDRTMLAALLLAARFNPNGFIRAWNGEANRGKAIVDCMMNLPLLYWASRQTGDPRFQKIALRHADTTLTYFRRADGSFNHIVDFDPETGAIRDIPAGQGCKSGSSWSRGQSWALYGFTLSYLNTGKQAYLEAARGAADYFIGALGEESIPRCDFCQPADDLLYDNAAGNIAACGLIELAKQLNREEGKRYFDAALRILKAQEARDADWTQASPAIFQKCCASYGDHRHMTMDYGDYFFIEAVNKLRGEEMLFWMP